MKVGPKSSLRPFLHQALQLLFIIWLNDFACCDWSIPGP